MHIRSKLYHYVLADKTTQSKHKGVSKKGMGEMATDTYFPSLGGTLLDDPVDQSEVFDPMTQVYRDCLFESEKKALCPIDTKRWILSDGVTTLPYRHWRIQAYKNMVKADSEKEKIYTIVNIKESIITLERDVTKIHQNLKTIAREIYYLYNAMAPEDFEKNVKK
ncbi:hypothetical protein GLOIN_2v1778545 [Rhizophagus clarus]|uniref:Uncharacterized protein n=1 Tax=Rhizophagus clarus TaxID=94130 RepID=A0A8H3M0M0_9GLOM|nr:hypothetical protein GLOIN_2v1778545 [Rhizophagus clarus]GES95461.1 hypothetical protein GLOIN_2v1778545 [Rhizophagus clarus]